MTEPIAGGPIDRDQALRREVEVLAQRFPDVDPDEIRTRVDETYAELREDATVRSHLVAVTENRVTHELHEEGAEIRPRDDDAPS